MGVKRYLSVGGQLLAEYQVDTDEYIGYMSDALGNVSSTVGSGGDKLNEYLYSPFGEMVKKTGSAPDPKYLWCGTWGYRASGNKWVSHYVRARHYSFADAAWTSVDPLWPSEMAYGYVEGRVMTGVDYWGTQVEPILKSDECWVYCAPLLTFDPPLYPICESACNSGLTISEMNEKFYDIMKRKRRGHYNPRHDTDCFAMVGSGGTAYFNCETCCVELYEGKDDCKLNRCTCYCSKFYAGNTGDCPLYAEARRQSSLDIPNVRVPSNAREIPWWEYLGGLMRRRTTPAVASRRQRRKPISKPPKIILPPGTIPPAGYQDPSSGRYY